MSERCDPPSWSDHWVHPDHSIVVNKGMYTLRDPQRLTPQSDEIGVAAGAFMRAMLDGPTPLARIGQAQALLRLAKEHGRERVDAACQHAYAYGIRNTNRVTDILLQGLSTPSDTDHEIAGEAAATAAASTIATTRFARPNTSFKHDRDLAMGAAWTPPSPPTCNAASSASRSRACSPPSTTAPPTPSTRNSTPSPSGGGAYVI